MTLERNDAALMLFQTFWQLQPVFFAGPSLGLEGDIPLYL